MLIYFGNSIFLNFIDGTAQAAGGGGAPVPSGPIGLPEMNAQCQMLSQACAQQGGMAPPAARKKKKT